MAFKDFLQNAMAYSDVGQAMQKRKIENALLEKQAIENELEKRKMNNPSIENDVMGKIFQTGDYGRKSVESNLRKIFNTPQGPLPEGQFNITQEAKKSVPSFQEKFPDLPETFENQSMGVATKYTDLKSKMKDPLDELLSPAEAEKLGVPFGTTKRQAQGKSAIRTKSPETIKFANDLRTEFINRPEVKDFMAIDTQVKSMESLVKSALSGNIKNQLALDQGLITMYNKLTDPQSVVRESEYARTPENIPILNRITGAIEKLKAGGAGLTNEDRQALVLGAKIIGNERGRQYKSTRQGYENIANQLGAETSLVIGTLPDFKEYQFNFQTGAPNPGKVEPPKTGKDTEAIIWAKANPNDPKSAQILKLNGLSQ